MMQWVKQSFSTLIIICLLFQANNLFSVRAEEREDLKSYSITEPHKLNSIMGDVEDTDLNNDRNFLDSENINSDDPYNDYFDPKDIYKTYSLENAIQFEGDNSSSQNPKYIMLEARIDVPLKVDLESAIQIALMNNLDIVESELNREINKWTLRENIGYFLPDYSIGLGINRFDGQFFIGGLFPIDALNTNINAFVRTEYMILEGGKKVFNTLSAKKLYDASKEYLSTTKKNIIYSVVSSYYTLLTEQGKLDVYSKSVDEAKENLKLNQNREKRGVGTKFNVLQADSQLAEQEQLFIDQQAKFRQASIELATILNLNQQTHIKPNVKDLQPLSSPIVEQPIDDLISTAFEHRSEIKQAKLEYKSKKHQIGTAISSNLPNLNLYLQYGGTGQTFFDDTSTSTVTPDAINLDNAGNPVPAARLAAQAASFSNVSNVQTAGGRPFRADVDRSLMSSLSYGLEFNWFLGQGLGVPLIAKLNKARKEADVSKNNLEKLRIDIEQEVRIAYLNFQAAQKSLKVSEKRVETSKEALRLARLRLNNGVGINTEVLDAQTSYKDSLASRVDAITKYNVAHADLLRSVGMINEKYFT